jgi:4-amino-4-deoxy-L-arabinose transferase-like glycosyltransferase
MRKDLAILLLTLSIVTWGIGNYGLYEPHEAHFAMVGKEMVLRGDWVTPHLNGAPYLNKPPLLYWSIALTTSIFGQSEWAARLPIAIAGWWGIVISWLWSRQLWGVTASRTAALMLSVSVGWFIFTHQILIDVLLGSLLLTTSYCLWRWLYRPKSVVYWLGFYCCLGLCFLTKGLIGIAFPLIGLFGLVIMRRDWRIIKQIKLFKGLLVFLAVILPWLIAIERANPGFINYFIFSEHLDRIFDRRFPPDYVVSKISALGYLGIAALWCFPWILFLPSVIIASWRDWQAGLTCDKHRSDGIFLLAIAAILPVICFLPLSSRLIYYSLPAIPPYIILVAGWWSQQDFLYRDLGIWGFGGLGEKVNRSPISLKKIYGWISLAIGICFCGAIVFLPIIINLLPPIVDAEVVEPLIVIVAIAMGLGWLLQEWGLLKKSRLAWIPLFLALAITYMAVVKGFILYQNLRSSIDLVKQADATLGSDTLWIFEGSREIGAAAGLSYYLNLDKKYSQTDANLPAGWVAGKDNLIYRNVLVLADGGNNRLPPKFPNQTPAYLINKTQLQTYWNSDRPVIFITDFLRQPNNPQDPESLNLPDNAGKFLFQVGSRKLYGNAILH